MKRHLKYKKVNIIGVYRNYILLGVCGILTVYSVIMTIDVSVSGAQISSLQKKEEILSSEKRVLEGELVKTSSISELRAESVDLGFVKPAETVYLSETAPVANIP